MWTWCHREERSDSNHCQNIWDGSLNMSSLHTQMIQFSIANVWHAAATSICVLPQKVKSGLSPDLLLLLSPCENTQEHKQKPPHEWMWRFQECSCRASDQLWKILSLKSTIKTRKKTVRVNHCWQASTVRRTVDVEDVVFKQKDTKSNTLRWSSGSCVWDNVTPSCLRAVKLSYMFLLSENDVAALTWRRCRVEISSDHLERGDRPTWNHRPACCTLHLCWLHLLLRARLL